MDTFTFVVENENNGTYTDAMKSSLVQFNKYDVNVAFNIIVRERAPIPRHRTTPPSLFNAPTIVK